MPLSFQQDFNIVMIAPRKDQCGISDYSDYLMDALSKRVTRIRRTDWENYSPENDRADLIHVQHEYFLFGGVAPWRNRCGHFLKSVGSPVVLTAHEFLPSTGNSLRSLMIRLTNRSNFMHPIIRRIVVHTSQDRYLMTLSGIPLEKVQLIRHGVPSPPALPSSLAMKREFGLANQFIVTIFGFLSRKKGHMDALRALSLLPKDIHLIFAGGRHPDDRTNYVQLIEKEITARGLNDRVRITGYLNREEIYKWMAATDLILAPFLHTSGSGSLAMAFSCAKPILASDIPPNMEYLEDTPDCIRVYPAAHSEKMADIIKTLAGDPSQRETLTSAAGEYARKHSYSSMAEETIALYRTLLSEA
jgi:glycosyltransferase involved in cell wall biosynthesis